MKFNKVSDHPRLCEAWKRHGGISEDGKAFIYSGLSSTLYGSWVKGACPIEDMLQLYRDYTLSPMFETCGGHFGRMLVESYRSGLNGLVGEGELLHKVVNGWKFSGNFWDLSAVHGIMVGDQEVAKALLTAIRDNYDKSEYRDAVEREYSPNAASHYHVYYNHKRAGIYVAKPNIYGFMNGDPRCFPTPREVKEWIPHAFEGAEYIGPRDQVDYAELLTDKMDDILRIITE